MYHKRTLTWVSVAIVPLALLMLPPTARVRRSRAQELQPQSITDITDQTLRTIRFDDMHDVSPPLRDIVPVARPKKKYAVPLLTFQLPEGPNPPAGLTEDMVLQRSIGPAFPGTVGLNFDGQSSSGLIPPDPNGSVGSTQYVQWVNDSFAVYSKTNGALLYGPAYGATLYSGFGGLCQTSNVEADGIVRYDHFTSRWVITFLAYNVSNGVIQFPIDHCIAVSRSSDATGAYNRYAYSFSNLPDYPKLGVWPNGPSSASYGGYYVTYNMFTSGNSFIGANMCAYDRNAMINGTSAQQVCNQLPSYEHALPSRYAAACCLPIPMVRLRRLRMNRTSCSIWVISSSLGAGCTPWTLPRTRPPVPCSN